MAADLLLWDHPVSCYAQKVRIALREKGIPFNFATPKGAGTGDLANMDPAFAKNNHRVEVPTLVDGDLTIFDSTIILEYLEDKYPDKPLRPADPAARARARMIEDVCDSQYEAINWGMGEVHGYKRAEGELARKMTDEAKQQAGEVQKWLTEQLGDAEWFGGVSLGWADVCVWPFVNRSTSYGMEPAADSALGKWYERAKQRPSVKSVHEEFVTATATFSSAAAEAIAKGLMRREYRDHRLEWMIKSGGIGVVKEGLEKNTIRFSWPCARE
ncbi:uncharacterized protein PV06_04014 [Exophiala oligosperma]|uniref:GST N-terminal domain-containing protein n=1 Tax=Exophiala oligosperma TaxID=215243 RepID=A0A0D2B0M1_9EURO|nr:uncharacterized protein PV06_04014 [Exophiala oligosperma]KIW45641.1 hypothetical protein PV06_04014 [Exophiala oligosperma]